MPRSRRSVSPLVIREVAIRLGDEIGDREVARQLGVSQTTIGNWRRGSRPNKATTPKLERWFARTGRRHYETGASVEDAFLAVRAITREMPPRRRKRAARRIDDAVRDEYERASVPVSPSAGGRLRRLIDTELR